jgi:hypothetical protein
VCEGRLCGGAWAGRPMFGGVFDVHATFEPTYTSRTEVRVVDVTSRIADRGASGRQTNAKHNRPRSLPSVRTDHAGTTTNVRTEHQ